MILASGVTGLFSGLVGVGGGLVIVHAFHMSCLVDDN